MNKLLLIGAMSLMSFGTMAKCKVLEGMYFDHSYQGIERFQSGSHAGGFIDIQKVDGKLILKRFFGESGVHTPKEYLVRTYKLEEDGVQTFKTFDPSTMEELKDGARATVKCEKNKIVINTITTYGTTKESLVFPRIGKKLYEQEYIESKEVQTLVEYKDFSSGTIKKQVGIIKRIKVGTAMAKHLRKAFLQ